MMLQYDPTLESSSMEVEEDLQLSQAASNAHARLSARAIGMLCGIMKDPAPLIVVSNLGDSAVDITTRSWVNSGDYWGVYFDLTENAKEAFDAAGISIPYPQTDVHVHQVSS